MKANRLKKGKFVAARKSKSSNGSGSSISSHGSNNAAPELSLSLDPTTRHDTEDPEVGKAVVLPTVPSTAGAQEGAQAGANVIANTDDVPISSVNTIRSSAKKQATAPMGLFEVYGSAKLGAGATLQSLKLNPWKTSAVQPDADAMETHVTSTASTRVTDIEASGAAVQEEIRRVESAN